MTDIRWSPKVGEACEYFYDNKQWRNCQVVADWDTRKVICDLSFDHAEIVKNHFLRPFNTLAAEAREKAVAEMLALTAYPGSPIARAVCEVIYDNDYRKQDYHE